MEYEDQIQSDKVDLVYPPILDDFNSNNITFYNETGGLSFFYTYIEQNGGKILIQNC